MTQSVCSVLSVVETDLMMVRTAGLGKRGMDSCSISVCELPPFGGKRLPPGEIIFSATLCEKKSASPPNGGF